MILTTFYEACTIGLTLALTENGTAGKCVGLRHFKENEMTSFEIAEILTKQGWKVDARGHLQKTSKRQGLDRTLRVKFQPISLRLEVKVIHPEGTYQKRTTSWVRLDGAYYRNIVLHEDGRIKIGNKIVGLKKEI